MRNPILLALVQAVILLSARPGPAWSIRASDADPAPWSFDAMIGGVTGGPGGDLMNAMLASGFGDERCWWDSCNHFPDRNSNTGLFSNLPFWAAARRRLGDGPFHVGLAGGSTGLGEVRGHRSSPPPTRCVDLYLDTDSKVRIFAAMAWYEYVPGVLPGAIRIGAGPTLTRLSIRFGGFVPPGDQTIEKTVTGCLAEIAATLPARSHVYLTVLAQYRYARPVPVAGWTGTCVDTGYTFASSKVRPSHAFFGIGLGGRF
jgi:hypothetical protein